LRGVGESCPVAKWALPKTCLPAMGVASLSVRNLRVFVVSNISGCMSRLGWNHIAAETTKAGSGRGPPEILLLNQEGWCPSRDSKCGPPECEAEAPPHEPVCPAAGPSGAAPCHSHSAQNSRQLFLSSSPGGERAGEDVLKKKVMRNWKIEK
jgi:hypothetical protein